MYIFSPFLYTNRCVSYVIREIKQGKEEIEMEKYKKNL